MSEYPAGYDTFRTPQNEPGVDYDPDQQTTVFSEDFASRSDAILAIQQVLGLNPQGSYTTVAELLVDVLQRVQQLELDVSLGDFVLFVTEDGEFMGTEDGDYLVFADADDHTLLAVD